MKKKAKNTKLKKEAERMFKESHVAVILEDMNDNIKLIAEGLSGTNRRLDQMEDRFDGLENKVDRLEEKTRENFRLVFEHFSNVEDELQDIKQKLEKIDKNKVDKKEFDLLKARVERLEKILTRKKATAAN